MLLKLSQDESLAASAVRTQHVICSLLGPLSRGQHISQDLACIISHFCTSIHGKLWFGPRKAPKWNAHSHFSHFALFFPALLLPDWNGCAYGCADSLKALIKILISGYGMDEIPSTLQTQAHSLWLPNGVKAYQKPHQSPWMSGAFIPCSSSSRVSL